MQLPKRGPDMPTDQTRSAILAAAERLYADRGFGDVTLRDIVAEANVNLAAVNYHFGSKDELIAELFVSGSIESVPPIRRIKNREIDHLRKFAGAMRRSLPDRSDVDIYWGLNFALAMAHHTIRESERLTKLSEGKCDLDDVEDVVARVVSVATMALTAGRTETKAPSRVVAR